MGKHKTELSLNKENPEVLKLLHNYKDKLKHFRYKKRYSFITYDKLFRFDLTVVKSSPMQKGVKLSKTFRAANILNNKEIYEMEIEYIGSELNKDGSKPVDSFYKNIIDGIEYISPYNLYFKRSPNPHGIISPMDYTVQPSEQFPGSDKIPDVIEKTDYDPDALYEPPSPSYDI